MTPFPSTRDGERAQRPQNAHREDFQILDPARIVSESPNAKRAEIGVAQGDWLGSAPFESRLFAQRKEDDIRLEWRLESLVPIEQIRQDREVRGFERVQTGRKLVGEAALVQESGDLSIAYGPLGTMLNLIIRKWHAQSQLARLLKPFNNVDELLLQKIQH